MREFAFTYHPSSFDFKYFSSPLVTTIKLIYGPFQARYMNYPDYISPLLRNRPVGFPIWYPVQRNYQLPMNVSEEWNEFLWFCILLFTHILRITITKTFSLKELIQPMVKSFNLRIVTSELVAFFKVRKSGGLIIEI